MGQNLVPVGYFFVGYSWNAPGTLLERSWNAPGTLLERSGNAPGTLWERSWNALGTFGEHSGNTIGIFLEHSGPSREPSERAVGSGTGVYRVELIAMI
jgi:hypothetical protein